MSETPLALDPLDLGAVFEYYWTAEWSKDLRDDIDNGKAYGPEDIKTVARYTWEAARKVLPAAPPQARDDIMHFLRKALVSQGLSHFKVDDIMTAMIDHGWPPAPSQPPPRGDA